MKKYAKQQTGNSFVLRSDDRIVDLLAAARRSPQDMLPMEQLMNSAWRALLNFPAGFGARFRGWERFQFGQGLECASPLVSTSDPRPVVSRIVPACLRFAARLPSRLD